MDKPIVIAKIHTRVVKIVNGVKYETGLLELPDSIIDATRLKGTNANHEHKEGS